MSRPISGSPIKRNPAGSLQFSSSLPDAETRRKEFDQRMRGQFVGPMPVAEFLDTFLPSTIKLLGPLRKKDLFQNILHGVNDELDMYEPFIGIVESKNIGRKRPSMIPGYKLVVTGNHTDPNSSESGKVKPDLCMYQVGTDVTTTTTQMDKVVMDIEVKVRSNLDPFVDNTGSTAFNQDTPFEASGGERTKTRRQIIDYATEVHRRQHRLHSFSLLITGKYCRFLRWDRSGAIVTERFNYIEDSQPLVKYLWRFVHASPKEQGFDGTVSPATNEERTLAQRYLGDFIRHGIERPVLRVQVPDSGKTRTYIIWYAFCEAESPTGRSTRGYPGFDLETKAVGFVKDTWRTLIDTVKKETETLRELNEAGVCNVPKLVCGGDLQDQCTRTGDFANASWARRLVPGIHQITPRVHHRFVTDVVGRPLDDFKHSKELVKVVFDAFLAHKQAYEKCRLLHRDISSGNILIVNVEGSDISRGILNDWDLSNNVDEIEKGARQYYRTGTWHFMSARLLINPSKLHTLQDDLESMFHVLLYNGLRYIRHNAGDELKSYMTKLFEYSFNDTKGELRGGDGKRAMILDDTLVDAGFNFENSAPFQDLLCCFLGYLNQWYNHCKQAPLATRLVAIALPKSQKCINKHDLALHTHDNMETAFRSALEFEDWTEDRGDDQFLKGVKRKSEEEVDTPATSRPKKRSKSIHTHA